MNRQQERSEKTRNSIFKSAESAFAQLGYDGAGIDDICRQAGVTKGAFYHHFAGKEDLFLTLLNGWLARLNAQFVPERAVGQDTSAALRELTPLLGQVLAAGHGQLPIYLEFWVRAMRDERVRVLLLEPYRHFNTFFADLVAAGMTAGSLKPFDPPQLGRVLVSFAVGLVVQGLMDPDSADWEAVGRAGLGLILDGLAQ